METSAKASINVEDAFYTLARDIKAKMEKKLVSYLWIQSAELSSATFHLFPPFLYLSETGFCFCDVTAGNVPSVKVASNPLKNTKKNPTDYFITLPV